MPLILGTNSIKDTGFDVANSLRFNRGSSDNLTRSTGTATNNDKATVSFWLKRSGSSSQGIIAEDTNGSNKFAFILNSNQKIELVQETGGSTEFNLITTRVFRDNSAWYHIVLAYDSTQGTASNRIKVYVNGVQETAFDTGTYPSSNVDFRFNKNSITQQIGSYENTAFMEGYLSEFVFIDGQQLAPDQFGEFDSDSGIWKPIDVSGLTFGNSGFYLDFEDSSALGNDKAGSNNFTVNNLTAIDQSTDTCTNNFATWNPLVGSNAGGSTYYSPTLANGNLKATPGNNAQNPIAVSTIGVSSGKWYAEFVLVSETDSGNASMIGVTDNLSAFQTENTQSSSQIIYGDNGTVYNSRAGDPTDTGTTFSTGNIIGVALDLDNNYIYFSVNGTFISSGNPTSGASGTGGFALGSGTNEYFFMVGDSRDGNTSVFQGNFGGTQTFAISSGNTDGNGYGNFEYSVPANYYSLCSKNLAEYG